MQRTNFMKIGVDQTHEKYFFLERASRSALMKYTIKSLIYVSATNIYLEYTGYITQF